MEFLQGLGIGLLGGCFVTFFCLFFIGLPYVRKKIFNNFNMVLCELLCDRLIDHVKSEGIIEDLVDFCNSYEQTYTNSHKTFDDYLVLVSHVHDSMSEDLPAQSEMILEIYNFCLRCKRSLGKDVYHNRFQDLYRQI